MGRLEGVGGRRSIRGSSTEKKQVGKASIATLQLQISSHIKINVQCVFFLLHLLAPCMAHSTSLKPTSNYLPTPGIGWTKDCPHGPVIVRHINALVLWRLH